MTEIERFEQIEDRIGNAITFHEPYYSEFFNPYGEPVFVRYDDEGIISSIGSFTKPEKHGHWIGRGENIYCSACRNHPLKDMDKDTVFYWKYEPTYCPNCGAIMESDKCRDD